MHMSFRFKGLTWESIDKFLGKIGCLCARHSHKWAEDFWENGIDWFEHQRGGYRKPELYDPIPEIEQEAKLFLLPECLKKATLFINSELVDFIDKRFYEIYNTINKTEK